MKWHNSVKPSDNARKNVMISVTFLWGGIILIPIVFAESALQNKPYREVFCDAVNDLIEKLKEYK